MNIDNLTLKCIDDTEDPCYFRLPEHRCGRIEGDGPCVHADRITKRRLQNSPKANDKS